MVMVKRIAEIDMLRGIAIIMMIIYHFLFDLNFFFNAKIPLTTGFYGIFQKIISSLFLLLVGISLYLSNIKPNAPFKKYLKRGVIVFCYGLLISLVTYVILREQYVIFGILHLIGISIILSYLFRKCNNLTLILSFVFIFLGLIIPNINSTSNTFLVLGFHTRDFLSLDYFPIFPWFGVVLLGVSLGNLLYKKAVVNNLNLEFQNNLLLRFLVLLGRNALKIYLLHQVVLFIFFQLIIFLS